MFLYFTKIPIAYKGHFSSVLWEVLLAELHCK